MWLKTVGSCVRRWLNLVRPQDTMRIQAKVFAAVVLFSTSAFAAEDTVILANKFVGILQYEAQFVKYREQCTATYRTVSPEILVSRNPDYFLGIRPGHKKWPAVATAYEAYFQEACSRPSKREFLDALANSYAKTLSSQQLRTAIKFYSSATGRVLISSHAQAQDALYKTWTAVNTQHLADTTAKFQRQIASLTQSE